MKPRLSHISEYLSGEDGTGFAALIVGIAGLAVIALRVSKIHFYLPLWRRSAHTT
jgi:hypothetical protein